MRKILTLTFTAFIFVLTARAQQSPDNYTWAEIEKGIITKTTLTQFTQILESRKTKAIDEKNEPMIARCLYLLLNIKDRKTEDSLFWKNAFFIDSTLAAPGTSIFLQSVMHYLKAERIIIYRQRFFHRGNKNLIASYNSSGAYHLMSAAELDSSIEKAFNTAISLSKDLKETAVEDIFWLSDDPVLFLFKPMLTDIFYGGYIRFISQSLSKHFPGTAVPKWLTINQEDFFRLNPDSIGLNIEELKLYILYRHWASEYSGNPSHYYFIETLARKGLFNSLITQNLTDSVYEKYLESLTSSSYNMVKAHGIYQLCLLWNESGKKYNPQMPSSNNYYYRQTMPGFHNEYRMHYSKALTLFETNAALLDSFAFMKNVLVKMTKDIRKSESSISLNNYQLPHEPILASIAYRNTKEIQFRLFRLNQNQKLSHIKWNNIKLLKSLVALQDSTIIIPETEDFQYHNSFLKLRPLPPGRYVFLYSDVMNDEQNSSIDYIEFDVTNIGIINNNERAFVLHRKTGKPVSNASAQLIKTTKSGIIYSNARINNAGFLLLQKGFDKLIVSAEGDTISESISINEMQYSENIYDPEEYEDLLEYYEDHLRLNIFTDRAIYRPGQTVFYKGIFLTTNPKTGEEIVLNWKNLKFPFFKKIFYKTMLKLSGQKAEINVVDPFDRDVDTLKILPNKFGSFTGKFQIPKDAATGTWRIETLDFESDDANEGEFQVEEYKRPSFELSIQKPKLEKCLGDSFSVLVKTRSFAGAGLNNITIRYAVDVTGSFMYDSVNEKTIRRNSQLLLQGVTTTDEKGEIRLYIVDSIMAGYKNVGYGVNMMTYTVDIEAIDGTGESHEESTEIQISSRPVSVQINIGNIIDRNDPGPISITTRSMFAGLLSKVVDIRIFAVPKTTSDFNAMSLPGVDTWIFPQEEMLKYFPSVKKETERKDPPILNLIFSTRIKTGGTEQLQLPMALMPAGEYRIEMSVEENGRQTGFHSKYFSVFDRTGSIQMPPGTRIFSFLPFNQFNQQQELTWLTGDADREVYAIYQLTYFERSRAGLKLKNTYDLRSEKAGLNEWRQLIPKTAVEKARITKIYIKNNQLYKTEQPIFITEKKAEAPEIIVEKYRAKLTPGSSENFQVSIKTRGIDIASELMTTMYDASLDKITKHEWTIPRLREQLYIGNEWGSGINFEQSATISKPHSGLHVPGLSGPALWWQTGEDFSPFHIEIDDNGEQIYNLQGQAAGVSVSDTRGLSEVVVTGYGIQKLSTASYQSISIRGMTSFKDYGKMLVIIDGVVYTKDISTINPNTIVSGQVLKGADATALYGSRAANGVLILSTTGPVTVNIPVPEPPLVVRKNFSETAFFFPKIYAERDGLYNIRFTLPESVTEWKWKMMAHTKTATFAYAEKTLVSQNMLMIQPDMPRFLYQGDQIVLKSRITNMDTNSASVNIKCYAEDLITGEDVTGIIFKIQPPKLDLNPASSGTGICMMTIPENFLHPLKIRITGRSASYADGEEHIIPIQAKKTLMSVQKKIVLDAWAETIVATPAMPANITPYGTALYITPKPESGMLNALPYLAFYPYNCAEQTFNKLLAHTVANRTVLKRGFPQYKNSELNDSLKSEVSSSLPYELSEQAMPWLNLSNHSALQQKQLGKLFDTASGNKMIESYLGEIMGMQNDGGGISWFKDGPSNIYISNYLLNGFGRIINDSLFHSGRLANKHAFDEFITRLIAYCDKPDPEGAAYINFQQYAMARTSWMKAYPVSPAVRQYLDSMLTNEWSNVDQHSLRYLATLIIITLRDPGAKPALRNKAIAELESIRQQAIADPANGIRWKELADEDDINSSTEEIVVLIAEAFETAGHSRETVDGIIHWLLTAKQEHRWSTTKSTAAVISLLNRNSDIKTEETKTLTAQSGNRLLSVNDNLLNGRLTDFKISNQGFDPEISLSKTGKLPTSGSLVWYYFTDNPTESSNSGVKIKKNLYRFVQRSQSWELLNAGDSVSVADKIRVNLVVESTKKLSYVFIDDRRAACFEPVDALSGYEYSKGFSYYKSVRDIGFQFFAESIPAGISKISYEIKVAKEGTFTNGISSLQCMYQPAVSAYSENLKIVVRSEQYKK